MDIAHTGEKMVKKDTFPTGRPIVENPVMAKKAWWAKRVMEEVERIAEGDKKGVEPAQLRKNAYKLVTDLQFPIDGYLMSNLNEVPKFLKKSWDCVIIVSGNAKVRIGKSTLAMQCAYYLAWLLNEIKKKNGEVPQDNKVPFDNSNVAFDPDGLMKLAEKKPKNSVLVYDEGRAGLDSARAMENINKAMQDFFQECGQYGHVILIVLPDFFKLSETTAVPRSLFLLNVYTDKNYNRGFFSFYSEHRKELLYIFGKKRWGSTAKYYAIDDNFHGKFSDYFPINKEIYDEEKRKALKKRRQTRLEVRWHKERDVCFYLLKKLNSLTAGEIANEVKRLTSIPLSLEGVQIAIKNVERKLESGYFSEIAQDADG
jgi:hypothetical protein